MVEASAVRAGDKAQNRMKPVIKLEDIHKTYQTGEVEVKAVRGVSLEILQGEFVALDGREWFWKIHDDEHARLFGPAHERPIFSRRH